MRSPDPKTHLEIARVLRVSRQRVAEIERSGLAKLRAAFGSNATGAASLFLRDDGVPELPGDYFGHRGDNGRQAAAKRSRGRFG